MKNYKHTLPIGAKLQSPKRVYTVEQVLGQGGFGITYKVSANIRVDNVVVRTSFAVKEFFMKESCERDSHDSICYSSPVKDKVEESKKDFLAEAQRLNKISLEHPNLIHVNEVFEANNTVYYVMEYLDGGSLRNYVRQYGALSEDGALEILLPIFKAVDFLHHNRMTHLDIKPDNIMLKRDADSGKIIPVLIDFGLSKHYDKNGKPTSSIRILGCSDGYAPMEQYVGINTFTPQADVYALAATLLFTLTGKDPVIATEMSKDKIVRDLPESICQNVKDAIVSAMKMRKEERTLDVRTLLISLDIQQKKTEKPKKITKLDSVTHDVKKTRTKRITIHNHETIKKSILLKCSVILGSILFVWFLFNGGKREEFVDLGLSVKWATCNLGATEPQAMGNVYKWGNDSIKYSKKWYDISGTKFDIAYTTSKGKCRMPTKNEFDELIEKCTWKFVVYKKQEGMMFTSKINGKKIFFPVTKYNEAVKEFGGWYWSGSAYDKDGDSWNMSFYKTVRSGIPTIWMDSNNYYMAIRPVMR